MSALFVSKCQFHGTALVRIPRERCSCVLLIFKRSSLKFFPFAKGFLWTDIMDPSQVDFFAEKYLVSIVPNFFHDVMYLIAGDIGPFFPGIPLEVPLWVAINLKQRHKCRIVAPKWMDIAMLESKKIEESESSVFTEVPCPPFMEVTNLIFNAASEDVSKTDDIRTLVKDIWDLRMAKLRSSMDAFIRSDERHAKVDNLTSMEINVVRLLLTRSLDHLDRIRKVADVSSTTRRFNEDLRTQ